MLRCQFLCHVLKALFFIKIALKLSYFCKKMQNFRALGTLPPHPHWPPPPDPQNSPLIANFWLRPCWYGSMEWNMQEKFNMEWKIYGIE